MAKRAVFCVLFVIEVYGENARQIVLDRIASETYFFFERILLSKTGFCSQAFRFIKKQSMI